MKIRTGFVSNSSSSSFIVQRQYVSDKQLYEIENHAEYGRLKGVGCHYDYPWEIEVDENYVRGETSMDNFDMYEFLEYIGINMNKVKFEKWG